MFSSPFSRQVGFNSTLMNQAELQNCLKSLHPKETEELTSVKSEKRRNDFIFGRYAAKIAAEHLVRDAEFYVLRDQKMPIWPSGYTGSITHTGSIVAACVADTKTHKALGLDIENRKRKFDSAIKFKLTSTELELKWLNSIPEKTNERTLLLFSAKECLFKLLYPIIKKNFYFKDAELTAYDDYFLAKLKHGLYSEHEIRIGWLLSEDYILTYSEIKK